MELLEDRNLLSGLVVVPSPQINDSELSSTTAIADNDTWADGVIFGQNSTQPLFEHFDGTRWSVVPSPTINGAVGEMAAVSSNDVWAVGGPDFVDNTSNAFIEHWDGTSWRIFPSPKLGNDATLGAVTAISANDVWAVGDTNPSKEGLLVEHFDGTRWGVVSNRAFTGLGPGADVTSSSSSDVWISDGTIFVHFNGTNWSQVPASTKPAINAGPMAEISPTNIWAVGIGSTSRNGFPRGLIEHWNGASWNVVPSPIARTNISSGLDGIAAVSANNVWAVGTTEVAENWDGTSWNVVPAPSGVRALTGLSALSDGTIVAVDGDTIVSNVSPAARASALGMHQPDGVLSAVAVGTSGVSQTRTTLALLGAAPVDQLLAMADTAAKRFASARYSVAGPQLVDNNGQDSFSEGKGIEFMVWA
jgi:hypothetical protein